MGTALALVGDPGPLSTVMTSATNPTPKLRIGYVPEHFSSPLLQLAAREPSIELVSCPSGTGQIMTALKEGHIHLAIALTEALTAGIVHKKAEYKIVGTYVTSYVLVHSALAARASAAEYFETIRLLPSSPLNWAVAVGKESKYQTLQDLKGEKIGISRIGSGSQVMASYMALQQGWVDADGKVEPLQFEVLDTFKNLRDGVNSGKAAAFVRPTPHTPHHATPPDADHHPLPLSIQMWEHFTTKPYLSELRFISHVPTPWASWIIVASSGVLSTPSQKTHLISFLKDLTLSVEDFDSEASRKGKSKEFVMNQFGYPEVDVVSWLEGVSYPKNGVQKVERKTMQLTLETLEQAGVLEPPANGQGWDLEDFVDTSVAQLV
ncbi:BZ3500_MvSof-1268-A1-R1_Chr3-3g06475 [Microbotryum saponariae]|uniref:BZ3500_MvSof-1268-A1-R1_Chr3-3g06475 protein n=1 Tax=Microbotryum saponariae TaxID=289078 RepID=A0A2X0NAK1_9BASI|nr:BZ3500_MvSof-1268-A1-R1_Chr3-3g06475 [Microbotryum saponariae]SDA04442.1 BZ3501_MvSof-1269-A2-R1_Chr3-2g06162 [Microbotryum saponariae]